jgi:thymidylate kinase
MVSGGLTFAVIGVDGAGKSTVVNELRRWLSWRLTTRLYYMGSQQPSVLTRIVGFASKVTSSVYHIGCKFTGAKSYISKFLAGPSRWFEYVRQITFARDRYKRYLAGQRNASQGLVVIYDRYPLEGVRLGARFMDGPWIAAMPHKEMGPAATFSSQIEQSFYRAIRPPDHLFVLQVSPEVSAKRKPDHDRQVVEAKALALKNASWNGWCMTEINADQPLDQVLLQIKTAIWNLL